MESFELYSCGTSWKKEGMKCVSIRFDQQKIRRQDRRNSLWYRQIQVERWKWGKMWKEAEKLGLFSVLHIYASLSSTDVLVVQTISSPASPQSRLGCRSQASVTQLPRIFLGWKNTIPNYLNSILQPSAVCFSSRLMLPPRSSAVWPYSRYFVPTRMG